MLSSMKRVCFTVSVVGLVVTSCLFWPSFFKMKDGIDAVRTTLTGLLMVIFALGVSLTIGSVCKAFERKLKFWKR